jgi:hypothetical protein
MGGMLRRSAVVVLLGSLLSCASAPDPDPITWYVLSPPPTADYPEGNLDTQITTWERLDTFPTSADCLKALLKIHNQIHRPVQCVPSDDPRLKYPWLFVPRSAV